MTVQLPCVRSYFSYSVFLLLNNHQYNYNITKSFLNVLYTVDCSPFNIENFPTANIYFTWESIKNISQIVKLLQHKMAQILNKVKMIHSKKNYIQYTICV